MPHCIIEYSKSLESSIKPLELVNAVHQGAIASELFDETHIKTRARAYEYFKVGTSDDTLIHVTAKLLSGRTNEQKTELSKRILVKLKKLQVSSVVITVQICEIDAESYSKAVM